MTSLHEHILGQMTSNPKITIYKVIRGKKAFDKAIKISKKPEDLLDLDTYYTSTEKQNAVLIIYSQQFRVNKRFGFKLIIGEDVNGEKFKTQLDNVQFRERLGKVW